MTITKNTEGNSIVFALEGRLDSLSSSDLQDIIIPAFDECLHITLDFDRLVYLSSAGLRVLLMAQKLANGRKGSLTVRKVSREVMDVFEMTGFSNILTLQQKN